MFGGDFSVTFTLVVISSTARDNLNSIAIFNF